MVELTCCRHPAGIGRPGTRLGRGLFAAAALVLAAAPAMAAPDPVEGEWLTEDGAARVVLGPCAAAVERLCGAVSWLQDPVNKPTHDVNNPDHRLRARPLMGLVIVRDMRSAAPGRWTGGKVYDPESGKTYSGKLRALGTGKLRIEGCILMICDGETWTRVR